LTSNRESYRRLRVRFSRHTSVFSRKEMPLELLQIDLFSTDGLCSPLRVPEMRPALQRSSQGQNLFLLGPVSHDGVCPTHLSGEPARYSSVSTRRGKQAVSLGHPQPGLAQYSGQCQSGSRLAHLRRFRSGADWTSPPPLRQRRVRCGAGSNGLCPGFHDHRPLLVAVALGRSFAGTKPP